MKDADTILGREACEALNLIKRIDSVQKDILEDYKDLFGGIGCITKNYHLHVDPEVRPQVDPPRTVPHAIHTAVKEELDRMADLGVIVRQKEPTKWVNSMTVVRKGSKVRVCLDPTKLNQALMRAHHPQNTLETIAAKLSGSRYFSTLDADSGY